MIQNYKTFQNFFFADCFRMPRRGYFTPKEAVEESLEILAVQNDSDDDNSVPEIGIRPPNELCRL